MNNPPLPAPLPSVSSPPGSPAASATSSVLSAADRMIALIARRDTIAENLAQAQSELEFEQFPNASARTTKARELNQLQSSYDTISKSIKVIDPNLEFKDREKNSEIAHERQRQEMQKTCLRIASQMSKLKANEKPEEFWHKFKQTCEAFRLKDSEAVLLLHALINEHPLGLPWYTNHIHHQAGVITMQELKESFYQGFLDGNWQTERIMSLMDVRFLPKEKVTSFVNRFSILMQSNEFGWSEYSPERSFLKHVMF